MKKLLTLLLSSFLLFGCTSDLVEETIDDDTTTTIAESYETDQKDEVALYLDTYQHLPNNYMTKDEARAAGWEGGSLSSVLPGKSIGGDYFGNYEELLPTDNEYHECDIDTQDKKERGAKRIIYSEDGDIWYTEDHYETFELLYGDGD